MTGLGVNHKLIRQAVGDLPIPGDIAAFEKSMSERSESVLRLRSDVDIETIPLATKPIPWYRLGHRVIRSAEGVASAQDSSEMVRPSRSLHYAGGDFYLQDAGSLLALSAAGADGDSLRGKVVCDLCAAPGGKASALLEAVGPEGFLLANEPIRSRVSTLKYILARTGSDRYAISSMDPEQLVQRATKKFDLVLVDAPCSGQALVSRGKQSTASLGQTQIEHSAARQRRILDAAIGLVKQGGRLVYSTCTFAAAENEDQIIRLHQMAGLKPGASEHLSEYETSPGCYRLWPHLHDCAGSFAATVQLEGTGELPGELERNKIELDQSLSNGKNRRKHRKRAEKRTETVPGELLQWFGKSLDPLRIIVDGSVVFGFPIDMPGWLDGVQVAGPELANLVGKSWRPSHQTAMRRGSAALAAATHRLDAESARQFVSGSPVRCEQSGWVVVRYGDRPLGWVKSNGTSGKNHLPAAARW